MEWWVILGRVAMPAISLKATPQQLILSGFSATTIEILFETLDASSFTSDDSSNSIGLMWSLVVVCLNEQSLANESYVGQRLKEKSGHGVQEIAMVWLPVGISHQSEPAVVPSHFSQEGEDEQQHLEAQFGALIINSFSSKSG